MKLYTEEEIRRTFGFEMHEIEFKSFMNAIKPIELPIDQEIKIKINENNTFSTSGTTSTTKLCTVFVPNKFVFQNRCKNCDKEANQHPIITPTI